MKIIRLEAENVKRLRCVEIVPDGSVVQITGANGSGKSSVLDAIWWALAGTSNVTAAPIRKGEQKARVRLDLGELVVTRRFTEGGGSLTVEHAATGARFPSPQRMLDELLGALTFDPLAFSRMKPAQQAETLRQLVNLDVSGFDNRARAAYDTRTEVNRRVRSLTERLDAIDTEIDPGMEIAPIDVSDLLRQMEEAAATNDARMNARRIRQAEDEQYAALVREIADVDEQIERLRRHRDRMEAERVRAEQLLAERVPVADLVDTAELRRKVEDAQRINSVRERQAQIRAKREAIADELTAQRAEADHFTAILEECEQKKRAAIAAAQFPIEGLSFDAQGGITYNGIPFEQASSAEQLRVSVAMAMAMHPKLRVLRIQDGSLLDEQSLQMIADMAEAHDYQCWIERVDTSGNVGIAMEDGAVKAVNGEPVPQLQEAATE